MPMIATALMAANGQRASVAALLLIAMCVDGRGRVRRDAFANR